ncbi:response regulator [Kiloniella antarctica]|uniref:Response regulator n=1 Tax=Kiloniella antarctica TaxID=1550907 RepID=A0ABW5BI86_9PROT
MKLLYIEDQPVNARVLSLFVEKLWGDYLSSVETAEESFELLINEDFDLIYMDINLPKMNGLEAVRHIKNQLNLKDIPIIVISANTNEKVISEAIESGCQGYLKKPVRIDELKRLTEEALKIN